MFMIDIMIEEVLKAVIKVTGVSEKMLKRNKRRMAFIKAKNSGGIKLINRR